MTMIVDFVDGATSATAPDTTGAVQENYPILNNMSAFANFTGLIFDHTQVKSAFGLIEIYRKHTVGGIVLEYRQLIDVQIWWDGLAWNMTKGLNSGIDMVQDTTLSNNYDVILDIDTTTGQMKCKSANMLGTAYEGYLLLSITRIDIP